MNKFFLLILLFFCAVLPVVYGADADTPELNPAANDEEWYLNRKIKDIVFDGLRTVRVTELEGITEPYIGKLLTYELYEELNGQVWALDYFEPNIKTSAIPFASDVIIRFTVKERPVISKIEFSGNKGLRRSELLNVVKVKPNEIVNQAKIRIDEQQLVEKYLEKGYPDIQVKSEIKTEKDGSVLVTFALDEGIKISVDNIYFEGNTVFSQKTLQNQLSLKTSKAASSIFTGGPFQEAKLIADRDTIIKFYRDRGYIDAEITDIIRDVTQDTKGNHLAITFRLIEGEKYTFGGIAFNGNHIFSEKDMQALVRSRTGDVINQSRLEADFMRIMNIYTQGGYIFNSIGQEEHRDNLNKTISYTVNIVERGRAHLENIIVTGNRKTKDYVILRELQVEEGDIFSQSKIQSGYSNLYNMQYFSNVVMDPKQGSEEGLMDLVVNVAEQPTTDLQAGLSFSGSTEPDAFPVSLLLKWTDRNFLGRGNTAGAEINAAFDTQSVSLQYTQKWLFGLPLSGGFDLTLGHSKRYAAMDNRGPYFEGDEPYAFPDGFYTWDDYNDAGKVPADEYLMTYEQWSISLGFSTGYRFWTPVGNLGVGFSTRVGLKFNDFDNSSHRPFDKALRTRNGEWTPANAIAFSVSLDKRDIYYDPSRGYYLNERFGIYGILPKEMEIEHFLRSDTKAEIFFTLWNWQVFEKWAFKGVFGLHTGLSIVLPQLGYEAPIIEDANRPSIDGMFVGRGWTSERLNRGYALWENWAELRIPLIDHILALDGFFDAAAVRPTPGDIFIKTSTEGIDFIDDMRFSFGAGLRFALPQFPFRFFFAKRFRTYNGKFSWIQGALLATDGKPETGIDFVISFTISTY